MWNRVGAHAQFVTPPNTHTHIFIIMLHGWEAGVLIREEKPSGSFAATSAAGQLVQTPLLASLMWKMCLLTHLRKCTQTIKRLHNGNVYWCMCRVWESAVSIHKTGEKKKNTAVGRHSWLFLKVEGCTHLRVHTHTNGLQLATGCTTLSRCIGRAESSISTNPYVCIWFSPFLNIARPHVLFHVTYSLGHSHEYWIN